MAAASPALSRAETTGGHRAGPHHSIIGREGGLQSTLWAGPETLARAAKAGTAPAQGPVRKNPISLKLGFQARITATPSISGLPLPDSRSKFSSDPEIKVESQWTGERLDRTNAFAVRIGPSVRIRNGQGEWQQAYQNLDAFDSMMTIAPIPTRHRTPDVAREDEELAVLRSSAHRPRRACAQTADRHLHAGAGG